MVILKISRKTAEKWIKNTDEQLIKAIKSERGASSRAIHFKISGFDW